MEYKNCKNCGKLYTFLSLSATPLCPACMKVMDEKYATVKQYVYDNPRCNMNQVSADCDVPVQQIQKWVREEKLTFAEDSAIGIGCERCGTMIKTGRYCDACKIEIHNEVGGIVRAHKQSKMPVAPQRNSAKMRFLDS